MSVYYYVIVSDTNKYASMLCRDGRFFNFLSSGNGKYDTHIFKTFNGAFKRLTTKKPGKKLTIPTFIRLTDDNISKYFDCNKNCIFSEYLP